MNIILVLDKSGSMQSMGSEPVESVNNFIRKQQAEEGINANITLYTFSNEINCVFKNVPLSECKEFKDYDPSGCTALYDAINQAIDSVENKENPTVMVIVTDGEDNSSKISAVKIKERMNELREKQGWKILFLAKGEDAFAEQEKLGVKSGVGFRERGGLESAMCFVSSTVSSFRANTK